MKTVCAWCGKDMGSTTSVHYENLISHGICEDCRFNLEYGSLSLEKFITKLDYPVMIVDQRVRVQGANQSAVEVLHESEEAMADQLAGDVIHCKYASFPEGCGETIHCAGCAIRNTAERTYKTGQSTRNVEAYNILNTPTGPKHMRILISTEKIGNRVLLQIDHLSDITADIVE